MQQTHRLCWVWIRKNPSKQILPGSLHSMPCALLGANTHVGSRTELIPWSSVLGFFFFIHLHHLRLPLHQIGMYKAGSVGSGQAIFLPFAWPGGDFAAESSSAWPRERPPQSRSSPATPWAVFLAVPHYLAFRGMWMKKRKNNMTDQRPHRKNFRETYSWYD